MNVTFVEKSEAGLKLILYDDNLHVMESDSFDDKYALNFHLQTLVKKCKIERSLMVVHDKIKNSVDISIAQDENSFFVN